MEWHGNEALRPFLLPLQHVQEDPDNARDHPEDNVEAIKRSYRAFGQQKPLVAHDGAVIAGNGQYLAAQLLGWTHIAVVTFEGTKEEAIAYALADNHTGESSRWNDAQLLDNLRLISDDLVVDAGWTAEDLDALAAKVAPPEFKSYDETLPDAEGEPGRIEVECPKCHHRFKRKK